MEPDARDMEDVNACTKSMFVLLLQYSKGFETQWDEKHKFIEEIKKLNAFQFKSPLGKARASNHRWPSPPLIVCSKTITKVEITN